MPAINLDNSTYAPISLSKTAMTTTMIALLCYFETVQEVGIRKKIRRTFHEVTHELDFGTGACAVAKAITDRMDRIDPESKL